MSLESFLNVTGANVKQENPGVAVSSKIALPNQHPARTEVSIDIGGSLAKIIYFVNDQNGRGSHINFTNFETKSIEKCIEFIKELWNGENDSGTRIITATGGGSIKFKDLFKKELGVDLILVDEMDSLVTGLNFFVEQVENEVFMYDERESPALEYESGLELEFPYILVNIGSGVSIMNVIGKDKFQRIGGTSFGGGTVWGLLCFLSNIVDYDEILKLSKNGDNRNVDLLVGDIYGGDYNKIGLKGSAIASTLGKLCKYAPNGREGKFNISDICRSVLYLASNNIGQLAYLHAKAHGTKRIYFSGFFIRGHAITMNTLSYAINFWSKGEIRARFLRHEGYIGAMGALIRGKSIKVTRGLKEIFCHATKLGEDLPATLGKLRAEKDDLVPFKLMPNPKNFLFDRLDPSTVNKFINILELDLNKFIHSPFGETIASVGKARDLTFKFLNLFRGHLETLKREPNSYGELNLKRLLELRGACIYEVGLGSIIEDEVMKENIIALNALPTLLGFLDTLDTRQRFKLIAQIILKECAKDWRERPMYQISRSKDHELRKSWIQESLNMDSFKGLVDKFKIYDTNGYNKAVIFTNNCTTELVLGIIPLAMYLLSLGTKIVLAAYSTSLYGGITVSCLRNLLSEISQIVPKFNNYMNENMIAVVGTGSTSFCMDYSKASNELNYECLDADLVVVKCIMSPLNINMDIRFSEDTIKIEADKSHNLDDPASAKVICIFEKNK